MYLNNVLLAQITQQNICGDRFKTLNDVQLAAASEYHITLYKAAEPIEEATTYLYPYFSLSARSLCAGAMVSGCGVRVQAPDSTCCTHAGHSAENWAGVMTPAGVKVTLWMCSKVSVDRHCEGGEGRS